MSLPWATWLDQLGWNIQDSLWDRKSFCGAPFLANPAARVLYPPDLFFRLLTPLSPEGSFNGLIVFHFLVLGLGGAIWAGRFSRNLIAANLGGWIWTLNGYLLSRIGLADPAFLFALAWIPWLMYCLESIEKRWAWFGLWVCGVLEVLAGRPDITLYTAYALAGWTLMVWGPRLLHRKSRARGFRVGKRLIVAGVLLGMVSAIQILPTLEFQALSINRSGKIPYQYYLNDSLRPVYFLLSFFPGGFGDPTHPNKDTLIGMPGTYWGVGAGYHEIYFYLGQATLLLSALGLGLGKTRVRWYWLLLGLISGVLAMGRFLPGYQWVFEWVPGWDGFRVPPRILVLAIPAAAYLSVIGLEGMLRRFGRRSSPAGEFKFQFSAPITITFLLLVAWVVSLSVAYGSDGLVRHVYAESYGVAVDMLSSDDQEILSDRAKGLSFAIQKGVFLGVLSCFLVLLAVRFPGPRARQLLFGLGILAVLDLGLTHGNYLRGVTQDDIQAAYRVDPILKSFQREFPEGRLMVAGNVLNYEKRQVHPYYFPGRLFMYPFENSSGYGPFLLDHFVQAFEEIDPGQTSYNYGLLLFMFYFENIRPEILSLFDVAAVVTTDAPVKGFPVVATHDYPGPTGRADRLFLTRNPHRYPRTFLTPEAGSESTPKPHAVIGSATLTATTPTELEIKVEAESPARLVVLETWYPGWKSWVNGVETPVERVGGAFRAVAVPLGSSTVRLSYEPTSWKRGQTLALSGLLAGFLLVGLMVIQKRIF